MPTGVASAGGRGGTYWQARGGSESGAVKAQRTVQVLCDLAPDAIAAATAEAWSYLDAPAESGVAAVIASGRSVSLRLAAVELLPAAPVVSAVLCLKRALLDAVCPMSVFVLFGCSDVPLRRCFSATRGRTSGTCCCASVWCGAARVTSSFPSASRSLRPSFPRRTTPRAVLTRCCRSPCAACSACWTGSTRRVCPRRAMIGAPFPPRACRPTARLLPSLASAPSSVPRSWPGRPRLLTRRLGGWLPLQAGAHFCASRAALWPRCRPRLALCRCDGRC